MGWSFESQRAVSQSTVIQYEIGKELTPVCTKIAEPGECDGIVGVAFSSGVVALVAFEVRNGEFSRCNQAEQWSLWSV